MKRQILLSFFALAFVTLFTACGGTTTVSPIPSLVVGKWTVTKAYYGNEESSADMYKGYEINFTNTNTYSVENPTGAPSLSLSPLNSGVYEIDVFNNNQLTFDKGTTTSSKHSIIIVNNTKMVTETYVTLPGKLRTLYRFELARK